MHRFSPTNLKDNTSELSYFHPGVSVSIQTLCKLFSIRYLDFFLCLSISFPNSTAKTHVDKGGGEGGSMVTLSPYFTRKRGRFG